MIRRSRHEAARRRDGLRPGQPPSFKGRQPPAELGIERERSRRDRAAERTGPALHPGSGRPGRHGRWLASGFSRKPGRHRSRRGRAAPRRLACRTGCPASQRPQRRAPRSWQARHRSAARRVRSRQGAAPILPQAVRRGSLRIRRHRSGLLAIAPGRCRATVPRPGWHPPSRLRQPRPRLRRRRREPSWQRGAPTPVAVPGSRRRPPVPTGPASAS